MITDAHTCSHIRRGPAGQRVHTSWHMRGRLHTSSHVLTHDHTSSHMLTPVRKCSHMLTHAYTCSHVLHMNARFPFPAPTGFWFGSFSVCFTMVFEGFAPKPFCQFSKIAKTLGPFNKNSTSKFAHSCTQPQVGQHAPKRPQGGPQAAVQKYRKR